MSPHSIHRLRWLQIQIYIITKCVECCFCMTVCVCWRWRFRMQSKCMSVHIMEVVNETISLLFEWWLMLPGVIAPLDYQQCTPMPFIRMTNNHRHRWRVYVVYLCEWNLPLLICAHGARPDGPTSRMLQNTRKTYTHQIHFMVSSWCMVPRLHGASPTWLMVNFHFVIFPAHWVCFIFGTQRWVAGGRPYQQPAR